MRPLQVVDVTEPLALLAPLREALFEDGPAVVPKPTDAPATWSAPKEVPDSVALVIETSGSTGRPKRVALSATALLASARASVAELGGPGQWVLALPTHYIAGVMVLVRSLLGDFAPRALPASFSPEVFLQRGEQIRSETSGALYTSLVPTQLAKLLEAASSDDRLTAVMTSFDRILVGGQAVPPGLVERAMEAGYRITKTYGSSETAGGCVWDGYPIGDTEVRILDGQVALAGPTLAEGYLDDVERTEQSFIVWEGKRWFRSDDRGEIDDSGKLTVTGRVDDVIVSGGVKVSLGDIDAVVHQMVEDGEVCVVAVSHETWGEVPVVISSTPLDRDSVRAFVKERLGAAAQPHQVLHLASMPRLSSGKLDRVTLTAIAKEHS